MVSKLLLMTLAASSCFSQLLASAESVEPSHRVKIRNDERPQKLFQIALIGEVLRIEAEENIIGNQRYQWKLQDNIGASVELLSQETVTIT